MTFTFPPATMSPVRKHSALIGARSTFQVLKEKWTNAILTLGNLAFLRLPHSVFSVSSSETFNLHIPVGKMGLLD